MNNYFKTYSDENTEENVLAGIVGAFLFALAGGLIWFLLYLIGFMASISGLVGAVCAIKGYSLFSKKESIKGIVISVVIALLVMVLAWYLCLSLDVYNAYQGWYEAGEVEFTLTFGESVQCAYLFLEEPEIALSYFGNLAMGLVFCIIGGGSYVYNKIKSVKNAKNEPGNVASSSEPFSDNDCTEDK